ncbi:LacI family DNA-binding transcriptional regulator [Aestuariicoccus sp. MJ-SS9]|uniref:LacI family DNA-binding transcriptional regulator n=1 Tax=Aestuariicoccus sp. MJ-SS9 TaxID=3079855 RepID=UPI00290E6091|nr:LacI family DNA-binding transcriptional regulator [Aestuariicoccus sp. MJ-SS9]MDU8911404.1 LacI family DNA-binding transcriptional regulator [Aestuariicoccus sp. MJ-SS9]
MAHRFLVKDIALQAGVGTATVDRVLNGRGGVRAQTADRVRHAIAELESQSAQLALSGRKMFIDLLVEAPQTFIDALDVALREELPLMQPAVIRARRDMRVRFAVSDMLAGMERVRRRGSHGVIVMGPEAARLKDGIDRLEAAGIPVVTLASDMEGTRRRGYVGLDNARAGAVAAWLMARWLPDLAAPRVLVTLRNDRFRGEEERAQGFRAELARLCPAARIETLAEGVAPGFAAEVAARAPEALYSVGGGNRRLVREMEARGHRPRVIVAHDLDPDNRALLAEGRIDVLLYHDLREDIRNACRIFTALRLRQPPPAPAEGAALRMLVPPVVR